MSGGKGRVNQNVILLNKESTPRFNDHGDDYPIKNTKRMPVLQQQYDRVGYRVHRQPEPQQVQRIRA